MRRLQTQKLIFWLLLVGAILLFGVGQTISFIKSETATSGEVIINEFVAANATGLTDADGDTSDWIELHNPSSLPVNLAGWALTDDPKMPQKWQLPDMTLAGRAYLVVFASGKNRSQAEAELHTNFKLQSNSEFLGLYNVLEAKFMSALPAPYPAQVDDVAYGRYGAEARYGYLAHPTPGQANDESTVWVDRVAPVSFSHERGFYSQPFTVTLSSATPGSIIRYTTNGSEPSQDNGILYDQPLSISQTTLLRTAAFRSGFLANAMQTQSYIFLDDVLSQPADPPSFPPTWGQHSLDFAGYHTGEAVQADYEIDPELVNDPRYHDQIKPGLQALPSISIVTAGQNFDIYANPRQRGVEWERPVSMEFIYPNNERAGFQVNAGIRIQGGAGRWEFMPKHSFRLLFKNVYGPGRLAYPLFPDSAVEKFNTLVLRAGVDRSYAGHPESADHRLTTYSRDEWVRASQIAMTGSGSHGLFVHLYLNGLYWGLYNLVERPDAAFAASYFGGAEKDWYVINHRGTMSGSSDRFKQLIKLAERGHLDRPEVYAEVQSLLDVEQFADYLILNWYAGTRDWPENNWYAAMANPNGKLQFFTWDAEASWREGAEIQLGPDDLAGGPNIIKILVEALRQNPEFRLTLADRMAKHLFNDGALTEANSQARWAAINAPLSQAIIGESLRWGDARYETPITPDDWQRAYDQVLAQMVGNGPRLIEQARAEDLYPPLDPPQFSQSGGLVPAGTPLTMLAPGGTIYFTTDGSDPRTPLSGTVSATAQTYETPLLLLGQLQLKARVLLPPATAGGAPMWSALREASFVGDELPSQLRLTEIMYHPVEGGDYEFIELKNIGPTEVVLANASFSGIDYTFPPNTPPLAAQAMLVLVRNERAFQEKYPGVPIAGVYDSQLANEGEQITLSNPAGELLLSVEYDDENGWPLSADGRGDSLVLIDPAGDPNDPRNWRASERINGSPGRDDGPL